MKHVHNTQHEWKGVILFLESHYTWKQGAVSPPPPTLHLHCPDQPWFWQGWHQRRALTLGELGLPAVSNQVYFEVRDTGTPRAKAAASPTPSPHHDSQPLSPSPWQRPHSCIDPRCCCPVVKGFLPKRTPNNDLEATVILCSQCAFL